MSFVEIATLFGGIALFLFGMSSMGDSLKSLAGNKMETYLYKLSSTPLKGFLLGILVTAVIQSSSATTVMVVSFVNAGMMGFSQAVCVVLGSTIGTTMTSWILSLSGASSSGAGAIFSTEVLFSVFILIGVLMKIFTSKHTTKQIGMVLVGLGTILLAMHTISGAIEPLKTNPTFQNILVEFDNNPFLSIIAGIFVAGVVQSASAAVGILQAVALTCPISLNACLPLILGMNIGASVPVLFSMIGASKNGKRTALVYAIANMIGAMIICVVYYPLNAIFHFEIMTSMATANQLAIPILNTTQRVLIAIILVPLHKLLETTIYKILPIKESEVADEEEIDNLNESLLNYPPMALEQARIAVEKMAVLAKDNLLRSLSLLDNFDKAVFGVVQDKEGVVDKYEDKLGNFIIKIGQKDFDKLQVAEVSCLLSAIGDFERLSDHAVNLSESAQEIFEKKVTFTKEAKKELATLRLATEEILKMATDAFTMHDALFAEKVEPLEEVIDGLCKSIRGNHIERLQRNECTMLGGFVLNDLLTNMERVSDHCSNVAFSVFHSQDPSAEEHQYSERILLSPEFQTRLIEYRKKYTIELTSTEEK